MSEKKETRAQTLKTISNACIEELFDYMKSKNSHIVVAATNRALCFDAETHVGSDPFYGFFVDSGKNVNDAPPAIQEFIPTYWRYFEEEEAAESKLAVAEKQVEALTGPNTYAQQMYDQLSKKLDTSTFSEEEQELEKALEEEVALAKKAMGNAKAALEGAAHDMDKARAELTKARVPAWVKRIRRYAMKLQEKWAS